MRRNIVVALLNLVLFGFVIAPPAGAKKPALSRASVSYIEKLNSTGDLTQTARDAGLPNSGRTYCGPVAVSNSLIWLADHGFEKLAPALHDRRKAHIEVARSLGSDKYMNTSLKTGTGAGGILLGLARYIEDKGYEYRYLKFQGWRTHPERFSAGEGVPQLDWLKKGLKGDSAVLLNAGWYKFDPRKDEYTRIGGHWVTLVGYGVDEKGHEDPNILIVHDPSPRCGKSPHEYVRMELITAGRLTGNRAGLPRSAKGYYKMTGGMHVKSTADCAILDGAVVMKMKKSKLKNAR
ncbi:MAG: hypothetical protein ACYS8Z_14290 [Planctomycetota bacterium]|jgi:hypothetical protein